MYVHIDTLYRCKHCKVSFHNRCEKAALSPCDTSYFLTEKFSSQICIRLKARSNKMDTYLKFNSMHFMLSIIKKR